MTDVTVNALRVSKLIPILEALEGVVDEDDVQGTVDVLASAIVLMHTNGISLDDAINLITVQYEEIAKRIEK